MMQKTLARETRPLEGVGVHSGETARIVCRPAPPDSGLCFRNAVTGAVLPATLDAVNPDGILRRTVLRHPDGWSVETPEHLLSSCLALEIDNAEIEIAGSDEVPILDGSARLFAEALREAGVCEQPAARPAPTWTVAAPVFFRHGEAELAALPSDSHLTLSVFLDFPDTVVGNQSAVLRLDPESFLREVAPARTFALEADVERLRAAGLIRGGNLENSVVVGRDRYLNPPLRFPDECARHKIVDLLGDLSLVGGRPRGHFMAFRAGHVSHHAFGHHLRKDNRLRWIPPPTN